MTAFSIIVCVFVLDLHHRNSNTAVPPWVRRLLTGCLGRWLGFPVRHHELENGAVPGGGRRCVGRSDGSVTGGDISSTAGKRLRTSGQQTSLELPRRSPTDMDDRSRRQNSDRRASCNGFVVGGSVGLVDAADVSGTASPDLRRRYAASLHCGRRSSESLPVGSRRPSEADTQLLLSAVLAQLRYITANMRRHCRRAEVKNEWKTLVKFPSNWRPRRIRTIFGRY